MLASFSRMPRWNAKYFLNKKKVNLICNSKNNCEIRVVDFRDGIAILSKFTLYDEIYQKQKILKPQSSLK